jgi:acetolactate synthase-1/2/3 large subunit
MLGSKAIYKSLLKNQVKDVFLYSGGAIMSLVDLFKIKGAPQINYYINNHEQNCGHAATGYAKSTGKTGVVIVTSGPGLTNMVTPILDANNDSTPLIVLSGQVPISAMGTLAFQECPAVEITSPCTKWSYCAQKGDDLFELTNEAFKVATTGKKGAVHIDLPKCVLNQENGNRIIKKLNNSKSIINVDYNKLDYIINSSLYPIVYVGKGCNDYPDELLKFIQKYNLPTTTTIHAMGILDELNELSLGFLGMHGFPVANHAIQNADLIIAVGSRFDDRTTGNLSLYAPKCKNIIHVNIENSELGKIIDTTDQRTVHKVNIDCGVFLGKMNSLKLQKSTDRKNWNSMLSDWSCKYPITYNIPPNHKLNTQMVIEQIGKSMNQKNTIITSGVGNHQMMAAQFIRWRIPNQFITSGSLGVMGTGLPYAIGVQIANPTKTVIDIDGDGSFNHTLADLQTVYKHKLPIKIFIMNDGHMSMVRAWEKLFYNENYVATDCSSNPNYNKLANSYGIHSVTLSNQLELENVVNYVLKYNGPILCNAIVESDLCLPLVAPGKALDEMILLNKNNDNIKVSGLCPS